MTLEWYGRLLDRRKKEAGDDYSCMLNIFRIADSFSLGYCDISTPYREIYQYARIGYTIHNTFWGNGYSTECVALLKELGFSSLNFHRLEAHVNLDNLASKRVLEKSGFSFECVRKNFILEDGV